MLPLCLCRHLQHAVAQITSTLQPAQHFGPFEDVQLGPLLGQGSYGQVYRGVWQGAAVAIKVNWEVLPGQCVRQAGCSRKAVWARMRQTGPCKGSSCCAYEGGVLWGSWQGVAIAVKYHGGVCLVSVLGRQARSGQAVWG